MFGIQAAAPPQPADSQPIVVGFSSSASSGTALGDQRLHFGMSNLSGCELAEMLAHPPLLEAKGLAALSYGSANFSSFSLQVLRSMRLSCISKRRPHQHAHHRGLPPYICIISTMMYYCRVSVEQHNVGHSFLDI